MISMECETWLDVAGVEAAVTESAQPPLEKCAMLVRNDAVRSMKQGGRLSRIKGSKRKRSRTDVYFNSAIGRWVVPSKIGEPPHAQSKMLRNSIRHAPAGIDRYLVGPTSVAWYGHIHEFGGQNHPRRAFMMPALYRMMNKFVPLFAGLKLGLTRAGRRMNARGNW